MRARLILTSMLVLALVACGDDDDSGATTPDAGSADVGDDVAAPDVGIDAPDAADDAGEPDTPAPDAGADADTGADGGDLPPLTPLGLPENLIPTGDEFIVAWLPDTQIYAWRFPATFDSQIQWLVDHAEEYNIVFVSHVGDIVQNAQATDEWAVARAAYDWMDDIDLPHGFSIGGHDTSHGGGNPFPRPFDNTCSPFANTDCDSIDYLEHFGPAFYEDRAWFAGASPTGRSNAQVVTVDDLQLLFLHLPQDTPAEEVAWAHEILDAYPGALAHLTTHRYLFDYRLTELLPPPLNVLTAGRFNTLTYTLGGQSLLYNDGLSADELFRELVSPHPNIWSVTCGHVDAEFRRQADNSADLPVHEMLIDFQDMDDGGGGWLRLMIYRPSDNEVEAVTFSTLTGEVRRDGDGFEHSIEIVSYYRDAYGSELEAFGLSDEDVDALLQRIVEDEEFRAEYYESLYGEGARDSRFVLDVDFAAYMNAAQ